MSVTLAFDVYGTLINTDGVVVKLWEVVGSEAEAFSQTWRQKQLEYSFRRGLMQHYQNFSICTRQALDYACAFHDIPLADQAKDQLLDSYQSLPAFDDAAGGLKRLQTAGARLYAFSNGQASVVEAVLEAAGIRQYFLDVISVDALETFKPNPAVYRHFLSQSGTRKENAWLISGNPFDVIGAIAAGMRAAWVQRSPEVVFDPWGIEPTLTVTNLLELDITEMD